MGANASPRPDAAIGQLRFTFRSLFFPRQSTKHTLSHRQPRVKHTFRSIKYLAFCVGSSFSDPATCTPAQLDTSEEQPQVTPPTGALEPAREHHLTWAHAPRKILTPPFSQDLQHPDLVPGRWRELALSRLRTPSLLQTYARLWSRLSARSWEERVCRDLDPGLFKSGRM